ncbi:CDP-glycerol glycerophosphotransferase (TagB/SpsB family) [Spirochaeta isovalerica]|uniref:CDP-glycerol glycerophosphotransferase (TagB/SpsB family) n=1 Tax=Spirochaeta isovalerica TaxID=150 RepID=A0A841REG9_9SPIO|nr:CDP-glycerol glycerophosphotransferase (TagB/SpsB family) [Spirochaeta isovalerica]
MKKNYSFEESLHPHNKLIKTVTGQQLVDCDVVISDFGTMVYEAWALNKPVIFPRWILKDYIQEFLPGSAEAFIMENRIGFHPDSYDEMVDMINSGLKLTDDVNEFMEDYLPSELYSSSGKKIAETLLRLAEKTS